MERVAAAQGPGLPVGPPRDRVQAMWPHPDPGGSLNETSWQPPGTASHNREGGESHQHLANLCLDLSPGPDVGFKKEHVSGAGGHRLVSEGLGSLGRCWGQGWSRCPERGCEGTTPPCPRHRRP